MRALVIAAHPDDEVLGAGGTIAAMSAAGVDTTVLIVAEGVSLRHTEVSLDRARATCRAAGRVLGVDDIRFGGLATDGTLIGDGPQSAVVSLVREVVDDVQPALVLTHHAGDIHVDHRVVARSVEYVTRAMAGGPVRKVLHFEVLSSSEQQTGQTTPFVPNVFHDIAAFVERKCEALAVYDYEIFDGPHPRSAHGVRALAGYRGVTLGVTAAEAFVLGREFRDAAAWTGGAL
ncbi:PIG-L deacetylase family protein [Streptomyces sp. NPDC007856]|uniref:PIG-L deacetylase family protein n=1 Tax=Streptomyces sp. NPDC007856 TaxID=3364781 RepID=UPI0036A640BB